MKTFLQFTFIVTTVFALSGTANFFYYEGKDPISTIVVETVEKVSGYKIPTPGAKETNEAKTK